MVENICIIILPIVFHFFKIRNKSIQITLRLLFAINFFLLLFPFVLVEFGLYLAVPDLCSYVWSIDHAQILCVDYIGPSLILWLIEIR